MQRPIAIAVVLGSIGFAAPAFAGPPAKKAPIPSHAIAQCAAMVDKLCCLSPKSCDGALKLVLAARADVRSCRAGLRQLTTSFRIAIYGGGTSGRCEQQDPRDDSAGSRNDEPGSGAYRKMTFGRGPGDEVIFVSTVAAFLAASSHLQDAELDSATRELERLSQERLGTSTLDFDPRKERQERRARELHRRTKIDRLTVALAAASPCELFGRALCDESPCEPLLALLKKSKASPEQCRESAKKLAKAIEVAADEQIPVLDRIVLVELLEASPGLSVEEKAALQRRPAWPTEQ